MDIATRIEVVGGDFLSGRLPHGADLVSLIRVLHDHDDDAALALLRAIRSALPPDGALLIAEPMSGTPGSEPIGDALFRVLSSGHEKRPSTDARADRRTLARGGL